MKIDISITIEDYTILMYALFEKAQREADKKNIKLEDTKEFKLWKQI